MKLQRRIENALMIIESITDGKIDYKNLYDLQLHLSDALEQIQARDKKDLN